MPIASCADEHTRASIAFHDLEPLVTVIMPTYNNREVIGAAIESVLNQTLASWELLIIDDCSTDGTADYVASTFNDPRINMQVMPENLGSGACRNVAISMARGKYVAVLDADDECLPDRLERQVAAFSTHPDASVVASQVLEFGDWGGPCMGTWSTSEEIIEQKQQSNKMPVAHPTVMFLRQSLDRTGGYDVACRRAQDFALFLRLKHEKIICLEAPLVKYRTTRPISIQYAFRNEIYTRLALLRYDLQMQGVPNSQLPSNPRITYGTYVLTLRSWLIRNIKDYASLVFPMLRGRPSVHACR